MDFKQVKEKLILELKKVNLSDIDKEFFLKKIDESFVFECLSYYYDIYNFNDELKKLFTLYNFILNNH